MIEFSKKKQKSECYLRRLSARVRNIRDMEPTCADALSPLSDGQLDATVASTYLHHLLFDLLPHPRHPEEEGGLDLLEGDSQGAFESIGLGEVRTPAQHHHGEQVDDLCDVGKGVEGVEVGLIHSCDIEKEGLIQ
jgi:hypothetical protein